MKDFLAHDMIDQLAIVVIKVQSVTLYQQNDSYVAMMWKDLYY